MEDENAENADAESVSGHAEVTSPASSEAGAAAGSGVTSPTSGQLGETFRGIEYAESDVPNIIPKGSEMLPRRSICANEEDQVIIF